MDGMNFRYKNCVAMSRHFWKNINVNLPKITKWCTFDNFEEYFPKSKRMVTIATNFSEILLIHLDHPVPAVRGKHFWFLLIFLCLKAPWGSSKKCLKQQKTYTQGPPLSVISSHGRRIKECSRVKKISQTYIGKRGMGSTQRDYIYFQKICNF